MTGFDSADCSVVLGRDERAGLAGTVATGLLSIIAVLWLLSRVARSAIQSYRSAPQDRYKVIRTHVDAYLLCLLFADLFQGIGAVMNLRWVIAGRTFCSATCTAQGTIRELGEASVAMFTLAIAIHTFFAIFFQWVPPKGHLMSLIIMGCIWGYIILFVSINLGRHPYHPGGNEPYYSPTPFYCWIGKGFPIERIFGEYLWLWSCAFISIILYIPLYFCLRGNIRVDPNNWTHISFRRANADETGAYIVRGTSSQAEATKMLGYPIAYTIIVLPISVGRWLTYSNIETLSESQSSAGGSAHKFAMLILVGACIFGLSGFINVFLFIFTRPKLLSLNQTKSFRKSMMPTVVTVQQSVSQTSYPAHSRYSEEYSVKKEHALRSPIGETRGSDDHLPDWIEFTARGNPPDRDALGRLILKPGQAL